jgi:prepilin-type N-terminal cleavage/methylation domain-containing protein
MNIRPANRCAFTLVEVMLAIAILAMVTAAIYATWRAILGATKASQITAAEVQRSRVALRAIEESLTFAQMYVGNARYYWFNGENGSDAFLSFAASLPGNFPRSGRFGGFPLRRVEFSLQSGSEGGRDLVLRQSLVMRDFDVDERQYPLVLMKNVKKFEMEFWDEKKSDWADEWLATNQIPRLIRISIVTENPKRPYDRGEEYIRLISPAAVAVQPGWQGGGGAPGQPPGGPGGPGGVPPITLPGGIRK